VGIVTLERLLGCPEDHLKFHIWYLKENGLIQRMEDGTLAITAVGVDRVIGSGGPDRRMHQLPAANQHGGSHGNGGSHPNGGHHPGNGHGGNGGHPGTGPAGDPM
jgi:hypothetical protein